LTSIALLFPLEEGKIYAYSHSYMPKLRLAEHERTDEAPYRIWVNQGLITLTESPATYGIKTDYKFIIAHLKEIQEKYGLNIIGCGYDPHNAAAFLSDLSEVLICDLTEITQSARALNDATQDFQLSVKSHTVRYDKRNDLMTWSIVNAITTKNSFGEIKVDKMTQTERIDVVDAILDAWKLYFDSQNEADQIDANEIMDAWLGIVKGGEEN
jgi:phage terminase large subunit-like protein